MYYAAIADHGYTHERYCAFFPGYPLLIRYFSRLLEWVAHSALHRDSCLVLAGWLLSNTLFVAAAALFADLTQRLRIPHARTALLCFCFSPASIFMSALYTESAFSALTLLALLLVHSSHALLASLVIAVSVSIRSNGIVTSGFVLFSIVSGICPALPLFLLRRCSLKDVIASLRNNTTLRGLFGALLSAMLLSTIAAAPLFLIQSHHQRAWCSLTSSDWCRAAQTKLLPSFYSHVQQKYWNVGFLRYWTPSQIPNFILFFPMLHLVLSNVRGFRRLSPEPSSQQLLLPYVVHALFLALFALFCMHVQVGTRLLCSASPAVFWFAAATFHASPRGKVFVVSWFASYFLLGCLLFTNFYPWT